MQLMCTPLPRRRHAIHCVIDRWGQQTFDEMFVGMTSTFDADDPAKSEQAASP
jgi:hypothetical protein